jgi:hemolysin D
MTAATPPRRPPRGPRRSRLEREFLPAALEILDTPPSRMRSSVLLALCGLVVFGLACSWFGHVDIVAVADAQVVPGTRTVQIRSLESRTVTQLHVREGQRVAAQDPLVSLDPTDSQTELAGATAESDTASAGIRLVSMAAAALDGFPEGGIPDFEAEAAGGEGEAGAAGGERNASSAAELASLLRSELVGLADELQAIDHQCERLEVSRRAKESMLALYRELVPSRKELHDTSSRLRERKVVSEEDALRHRESWLTALTDQAKTEIELQELDSQRLELQARRRALLQGHRSKLQERLVNEKKTLDKAAIALTRLRHNRDKTVLRAPEAGVVHQLKIHAPGTAVAAGDTLLLIVPSQADLEIVASVKNEDIGWVRPGQEAKVKVLSFPYTTHGMLAATVNQIGADGVVHEQSGEVTFPVVLQLDPRQPASDLLGRLTPGMRCSAELQIATKRLLNVWLSPLERHARESFRER